MPDRNVKMIDLALQGGGAHGAFTWGVLDRILEDERLHIAGISGTSAGAMNTVALADGYTVNGRKGAQQALHEFWHAVSKAARFSPMQRTPVMKWVGHWSLDYSPGYRMARFFSNMFSPYQFNPLGINPLRDLVARQVNFDRVHACSDIELFVSATNVRTGRAKVFGRNEITLDAVMASACLPQVFHAVEIDGEAYWDGGYMGNPVLFPLVDKCKADDLIIVQINPVFRDEIPRTATEITNRLNEITFNASLTREISSILLLQQLIDEEGLDRSRCTQVRLHRISAEKELKNIGVSSKLNAEWAFLSHLHRIGYRAADQWLDCHFDALGKQSTLGLPC
jgi:NTE family protein